MSGFDDRRLKADDPVSTCLSRGGLSRRLPSFFRSVCSSDPRNGYATIMGLRHIVPALAIDSELGGGRVMILERDASEIRIVVGLPA
jgi:hypothetical protein